MSAQTADLAWLLRQKSPKDMGGRIAGAIRTTKWPVPEIVILAQYTPDKGTNTLARENGMSKASLRSGLEFMGLLRTKDAYHQRQKENAKPKAELRRKMAWITKMRIRIGAIGRQLSRLEAKVANIPRLAQRHANRGQLSLVRYYRQRLYKYIHYPPRTRHHKDMIARYGCTREQLMAHLEAQWQPGMSWDNHAWSGWHIDHIRPCSSFNMTDPKQVNACCHYTNLQPMWAKDNWSKSDRWGTPHPDVKDTVEVERT